jgi:2-amino-4-hydroxy-6-hydroxymethyldihydropteridine diphosphokinase
MGNTVYLLLGGNEGAVIDAFLSALVLIEHRIGSVKAQSSIYSSKAWGFDSEKDFLNQVVRIKTDLRPQSLLERTMQIENDLGRKRNVPGYTSRTIDIDILFYNDLILNLENLVIPHPRLHLRNFTLTPLNDIAPDYIHPVFLESISTLLANCTDNGHVKRI